MTNFGFPEDFMDVTRIAHALSAKHLRGTLFIRDDHYPDGFFGRQIGRMGGKSTHGSIKLMGCRIMNKWCHRRLRDTC
uniref:Uncharacterized protein n=1 Tax=mine drainage metagenome TaxID=410659 RepID=E6Q9L5_9ZZZZ